MIQSLVEFTLLASLFTGAGACIYFGVRKTKIKFSLQSIFLITTTACMGLAAIVAFGSDNVLRAGIQLSMAVIPLANLIVIAALVVLVTNSSGVRQAGYIGNLTPLVALAFLDGIHIITRQLAENYRPPFTFVFISVIMYLTAWLSGMVCQYVYSSTVGRRRAQHPLVGAYQSGLGDRKTDRKKKQQAERPAVPTVDSGGTSTNANVDEPNVYEIG